MCIYIYIITHVYTCSNKKCTYLGQKIQNPGTNGWELCWEAMAAFMASLTMHPASRERFRVQGLGFSHECCVGLLGVRGFPPGSDVLSKI